MEKTIHIQSEVARIKTIDRFCKLIALSSFPSFFIYLYFNVYILATAIGIIAVLFLFFIYLNKCGLYKISRIAIALTTNFGVIFFSFYLGYDSGIYLYLFVAPLLIYLLFDFNEKKFTYGFLFLYLTTFIVIFLNKNTRFSVANELSLTMMNLIYSFNFCSALVMCFMLVIYFANNNATYIANLTKHQALLLEEVNLRNTSEELLKKSLKEREILLSEVHHRVKNNLAIISALINLQIAKLKEEGESKDFFEETKNRIYSMSLIHNLLYANNSFTKIDFIKYVNTFCINISNSYKTQTTISIEQKIEAIEIDIKIAIPLGLILNELITNSFKHAFKNSNSGTITVGLSKHKNNNILFWVADSGIGMDEKMIYTTGMGMNIIHSLVEQIDGELKYEKKNGSIFEIKFPVVVPEKQQVF